MADPTPHTHDNAFRRSISQLLGDLFRNHPEPRIALRDVVAILGSRSYGLLILILTVPNLIPLPVPGMSAIFAVPIFLIALQLGLGRPSPWLPQKLLNKSFNTKTVSMLFGKAEPLLTKIEHALRPRWLVLSSDKMKIVIGLSIALLAIGMAIPIPLGHILMAFPMMFLALGLIEKDGYYILAGFCTGTLAILFYETIVKFGFEVAHMILAYLWG